MLDNLANVPPDEPTVSELRAARDAALQVARAAIRDTTRLTRLLTILGDRAPLEQLLDQVLSTLSELFSADMVVLLDPAGTGSFAPLASLGLPEDISHEPFSSAEGSYAVAAMSSRVPVRRDKLDADRHVDHQLRDIGALTGVWLPVISDVAVRGVLILARCRPIPFDHPEVGLLSAMTYRIGLSLEQAQRSIQLQAALAEVRRLNAELERRVDERTAELRLARDAAETANRAKSAFLAVMGHELRTPLNGIFLAAELLRDMAPSQSHQREYADVILATGQRLLRMVEGVLEYTSTDTNLSLASLDVAAAFEESAAHFRRGAAHKGITVRLNLEPNLPPLQADAHQLDKLLRRLIDNAIRFTPENGQVTITAQLAPAGDSANCGLREPALRADPDKLALRISVFDTGLGLRPEDCERIFEPFVQLESSYLEHAEGVGLGLTLARRQAEALGGRLWAESEGVGKGSRFVLMLPIS